MIKKILAISIIFAGTLSTALAGSFYFSPGINYEHLHSGDATYQGLTGMLNLGYGTWMYDCFYLAAEVFGNTKPYTLNKDNDESEINNFLKTGYAYGYSIVPAMVIENSVVAYLRLGYVQTDFPNLDAKPHAYQAGIGLEYPFQDCWSLRTEYVYTPYRSVEGVGTIYSNQVTLALVYRLEPLLGGFSTDL